jgi:hypothetical protein
MNSSGCGDPAWLHTSIIIKKIGNEGKEMEKVVLVHHLLTSDPRASDTVRLRLWRIGILSANLSTPTQVL